MAKKPFFPNDLPGQIIWLQDFQLSLPTFAAKYGITTAQLDGLEADKDWMIYWFQAGTTVRLYGQSVTAFRNEVAFGIPAGGVASVPPVLTDLGTPPVAVEPGVFKRALALANGIKAHKDYTISDGEAMGLEGAEIVPHDLSTVRPNLKPRIAGDTVEVQWNKQTLQVQALEIWVKRGAGDFAYLATDTTTPKYVDTHPFPAAEEKWTYKAIYRLGDGRVGLWSEEVSVTVKA